MKSLILRKCLMAAIGILAAGSVHAEYAVPEEVRAKIEPVLQKSVGDIDVHYFEGPSNMVGIGITRNNGTQMVVYATPDGETVFSGIAVDVATGKNIASADMQNLPPPNYDALLDMVAGNGDISTAVLTEGNPESENKYYVFVDPRCPYCHKTYNSFLSQLAAGKDLVVHYIPIGILGPESENIAKEIVGAPPAEGLELLRKIVRNEAHLSSAEAVAKGDRAHGANLALFRKLQFDAVPVIISKVGGHSKVRKGQIQDADLVQELQIAAVDKLASYSP